MCIRDRHSADLRLIMREEFSRWTAEKDILPPSFTKRASRILIIISVSYTHLDVYKRQTFHSVGVGAILALIGVAITAILLVKRVKGGLLYGILIT